MKRRDFLSKSASGAAAFAIAPSVFTTSEPAFATSSHRLERSAATWHERPLRIYHPNARASEMESLDVRPFIADCRATGAEAVVVSAGGIYAFYPSKVKYHRVSPISGKRDLLGETALEARRQNVKVIARVDFSRARADVFNDHPEWFRRDAQGQPVSQGADYYSTCTLAGYRNEGFAYEVIREIQELYRVHGFHLNAGAFPTCHCRTCVNAYGGPLPADEKTTHPTVWREFLEWRREAHSRQLAGYYRVMRELDPESFFMAELFLGREYHIPTLARHNSFSQLLFTAGELHRERGSTQDGRLEVALTSDHGRAVAGTRPLINIKMHMRSLRLSQSYMPSAEFFYGAYQALAHGAGLKLVTLAVPKNVLDARTLPDLTKVFGFMRQQQKVLDTAQPIVQAALVWPDRALLEEGPAASALQAEASGLYNGLKMRHASLGLLFDEQLSEERLRSYDVVVLPTAVWLSEEQAAAVAGYVRTGGRLVLLDSVAPDATSFGRMPKALVALLGGTWTQRAKRARYTTLTTQTPPPALRGCGPIPLTVPYREMTPASRAHVWYSDAHSEDAIPEDIEDLTVGSDPVVLFTHVDKGSVVYVATGLGQMIQGIGHVDYITMLESFVYHGLAKPRPLVTTAPSTVTVTSARWQDGDVVHLVNGTGPSPLDAVIPLGPIELDLAWSGPARAELVVPGEPAQALPVRLTRAGRLVMTVPLLGAYAQVVVRRSEA